MTTATEISSLVRAPEVIGPAMILPGGPGRLVLSEAEVSSWGLAEEQAIGYFKHRGTDLIEELQAAGLRGRGGAGFPAHIKWRGVASATGEKVVVANGHEGEPASVKDRWLLTRRPELVIDGLLLAARSVGAARAIVYLSHPDSIAAVKQAIADVEAAGLVPDGVRLECFVTGRAYVAGEESAVCRAINGGPALPTSKPPRPFESGVDGLPTLISNVETLAQAAWIALHGAEAFRAVGTAESAGTALFTLGYPGVGTVVCEAPLGTTVGDLFATMDLRPEQFSGLLMGGWFGGVLQGELESLPCSYEAVAARGSGLGAACLTGLAPDADVLAIAAELASWFQQESAGQCGVCINGTKAISHALGKASLGTAEKADRDNLLRWGSTLSNRGACAFINGSATLARSVSVEIGKRAAAAPSKEKQHASEH
ncbi:NADH-ubiquinone oxidoreductase-F iron-sulfur binding region domain-containing protein [Paenarthrobacter nitroguajacolicus]|uniref:NADH-ubiquinone oxidoreductase-F iron-sulfur binding region domain-containing protein n=1 Tax=Paenarthrobacter nitroguajacolicus TaxID=211146 RepID=UPI0034147DA9